MEDIKEKLSTEMLYEGLEKKILEETYRTIKYDEDCKLIASEYSKLDVRIKNEEDNKQSGQNLTREILSSNVNAIVEYSKWNIIRSKLKNIFNAIQLFFMRLVQNGKNTNKDIEKDDIYYSTRIQAQKNLNVDAKTKEIMKIRK